MTTRIEQVQDKKKTLTGQRRNTCTIKTSYVSILRLPSFYLYKLQTIKVITKLPNSEQSYKGKVKTHNYINRQNQSTTGKL